MPAGRRDIDGTGPAAGWPEQLVRWLDDGFTIPGTSFRIGLDGILGLLLPTAGDAMTTVASLALLGLAIKRRVPKVVLARIAVNIALDALIGAVPVIGDIFDFAYRSNRKNLQLIEASSQRAGVPARPQWSDALVVGSAVLLVLVALALPFVIAGSLLALAIDAFR